MTGEILFLCHRIPFPPDRGDKIRSYHILKHLAKVAPVHVGCFADDDRDMSFAPALSDIAESHCLLRRDRSKLAAGISGLLKGQPMLVSMFEHSALHHWVRERLKSRPIRAIVTYSAQMAHFVPPLDPGIRFIMDFVDFDSAKYAAYGAAGTGPMAWVNRREGRRLFDFEKQVAARADICCFVTEAEAEMFRQASGLGSDRIVAVDNGVDLAYFDPDAKHVPVEKPAGPLIVFTGQMDYRPNIEAVESFAHETLPLVREKHPDAIFAIVGRKPTDAVKALAEMSGAIVTGEVADVRGWLIAADVVVAPLRIARGVQNKVLEALSMARPVVASPQAAEGIDAQDGAHFLIAANPHEEANSIIRLLSDPLEAERLGTAARGQMEQRYRWSATLARLDGLLS